MLGFSVKYALFDMDGTLADTMQYWRSCIREHLADEGVDLTDEQEKAIEAQPAQVALDYVRSLHLSPRADEITPEDVFRVLLRHYENDAVAKPGAAELLEELKQSGARMGIATLTPEPLARACLARIGFLSYFDFILGGEAYPEGKSKPRIFLDAAEKFGCEPTEMHLFEDSYYSVKTAREIGIPVIGVADRYQVRERDAMIGASVAFFDEGFTVRVK